QSKFDISITLAISDVVRIWLAKIGNNDTIFIIFINENSASILCDHLLRINLKINSANDYDRCIIFNIKDQLSDLEIMRICTDMCMMCLSGETVSVLRLPGSLCSTVKDAFQFPFRNSSHIHIIQTLQTIIQDGKDVLFIYPLRKLNEFDVKIPALSIRVMDTWYLEDGNYINDIIITFYNMYIYNELIDDSVRKRVYFYNTFFYQQINNSRNFNESYNKVKKWTKDINIFDMEFLFIPIHNIDHWYLIIVHFQGNKSTIYILNSVTYINTSYKSPMAIKRYLLAEWNSKMKTPDKLNLETINVIIPQVLQQQNNFDCGIFVIQFIESFFKNPIDSLVVMHHIVNWFTYNDISNKRKDILNLFSKLTKNYKKYVQNKDTNWNENNTILRHFNKIILNSNLKNISIMASGIYGGDEVGAVVIDVGSYSVRVGYAGEDAPRWDIPTHMGQRTNEDGSKNYFIGSNQINHPIQNMDIVSYVKHGLIDDFTLFEQKLNHIYNNCLHSSSEVHPLLMSEPVWNTKAQREQMCELIFETYNVPAYYVSKSAVLSAFSHGKSAALVVDSGAVHTTCTPVYDGYILNNAVVKSPLGGDFISIQSKLLLSKMNIDITPQYLVESKVHTSVLEKPNFKRKELKNVTDSFHNYSTKRLLQDFSFHVTNVNLESFNKDQTEKINGGFDVIPVTYSFPNGCSHDFTKERYRICEGLFNANCMEDIFNSNALTTSNAILTSMSLCDVDIRPLLCNNIISVGGNSLIKGFNERLANELSQFKNNKIKLLSTNNIPSEKRFSSWVGGSILASLGSFQQMWISKEEYEENGRRIIDRKC
ncbi:Actin-like protein 4, partial [Intoshia linei]